MQSDDKGKGKGPEVQAAENMIPRLRHRIIALEKELALYGSKYGFTETARELLLAPKEN